MIAACGGKSMICNLSECEDALAALYAAEILGARINSPAKNCFKITAEGNDVLPEEINVQESGTVLRFILPLIALRKGKVTVTARGTLRGRPNHLLIQTLRKMGASMSGRGLQERVPIVYKGGRLSGGRVKIDGTLSSQFISALLIACPQLQEDTHLFLEGKNLVSSDYVTMTIEVLKRSGVKIVKKNHREFLMRGQQVFRGLDNFVVPSDYGLAAFHLAAASLISSRVTLEGIFEDTLPQADGRILALLEKMGVHFSRTKTAIKICGPFEFKGGKFSLQNCPDLVPIMAVLALFAKGKTTLTDISHVRAKESDRITDLRTELLKTGADIREMEDAMIISPQKSYHRNIVFDPHQDHRLAMAFSVLGLKLGVAVKDIECCSKSYPGFVHDFQDVGAKFIKSKIV